MELQKFAAAPALADYVEHYWVMEDEATPEAPVMHAVLPATIQSAIVVFGEPYQTITFDGREIRDIHQGLVLGRVTTKRLYLRQTGRVGVFGVRFCPTGFYNLFGVPMQHATDTTLELDSAAGQFGRELTRRVMEADSHAARVQVAEELLLRQLSKVHPRLDAIDFVASSIVRQNGLVSMDGLLHTANLGVRQLERRFLAKVGTSPKLYAQIARFGHVFKLLKNEPRAEWVDVAYRCGYYDQAHLIREFRRFTGETPVAYFSHYDAFAKFFWAR
ncbi:helix-turn-helix domain-containing protein [Hymenobacter busanensis]|nr:helix-turn-helix domain-containing protein [Hymenobacter busanensis]QHJ06707.1 helix-turn-helix domain-containing protein [Hymenobacter busanensis]